MNGISASLSGIATAGQGLAVAANNVANLNTAGFQAKRLNQESLAQGGVRATGLSSDTTPTTPGGSNVDLAAEAITTKTDGASYKANLAVLKVQDELMGTLLDMKA
jgi:flagellar hook protein FlgE